MNLLTYPIQLTSCELFQWFRVSLASSSGDFSHTKLALDSVHVGRLKFLFRNSNYPICITIVLHIIYWIWGLLLINGWISFIPIIGLMSVLFFVNYWSKLLNMLLSLFYNSPFELCRLDDPMLHWILHGIRAGIKANTKSQKLQLMH